MKKAIYILLIILVAASMILALLPMMAKAADGEGVVLGQVSNGTAGSITSVENITVTLKTYVDDTETSSVETTTDEEGKFQFSGLATGSSYSYEITLRYPAEPEEGADYTTGRIQFEPEETSKDVAISVYDTTTAADNISILGAHIVVRVGEGNLQVAQYYLITNDGDRTYVGAEVIPGDGRKATLKFPLPSGAADLQLIQGLMECCVVNTAEGLADTMAVIPGLEQRRELAFAYSVKYSSSSYGLSQKLEFPTDVVNVFVQEREGLRVSSDQLAEATRWEQLPDYIHLKGQIVEAGTTLSINLSGLPEASPQQTLRWVVIGVAALALGFGVGYPLLNKKRPGLKTAGSVSPLQEREELLRQIAHLDDEFAVGRIAESQYRRRRQQKKARLVELAQRLRKKG